MTKLLPYRIEYDVLKESIEDFKSRLENMPAHLLLNEHRILSEQYGIDLYKTKGELRDTQSKIYARISMVHEKILGLVHSLQDQLWASDYYSEQEFKKMIKEKNVKVSKNSDQ